MKVFEKLRFKEKSIKIHGEMSTALIGKLLKRSPLPSDSSCTN